MPVQVPNLSLPCCTDPNIVNGLVRNAVRRHTVSFDQNCSQVLGCNMTPDVLTEVNRLVGALGSSFDTTIQTIASALPTVGIDRILTAIDSAAGQVVNAAEGAVNGVVNQLTEEVNSVVADVTSEITSGVQGILNYSAEQLAELNREIAEAQQAVNQTITDVVGSVNRELNTVANTIASSITNTVNDILPRAEISQLNQSISQVIRCPV